MPDSAQQITAIVHRYCELFDTGQLDEFAAQFEHGQCVTTRVAGSAPVLTP